MSIIMFRNFKMTDKYVGNTAVLKEVTEYRWSKQYGLQCKMFGKWTKSEYTLKELLAGDAGHFQEIC